MAPDPTARRARARWRLAAALVGSCIAVTVVPAAPAPAALAAPAAPPAVAEEPAESRAVELAAMRPLAPGVPDAPHIGRDLAGVEVSSPEHDRAAAGYDAVATALADAQRTHRDAARSVGELTIRQGQVGAQLAAASAREAAHRVQHETVRTALQDLLIAGFISAGTETGIEGFLDPATANDPARHRVLTEAASDSLVAEEQRTRSLLDRATSDRRAAEQLRDEAAVAAAAAVGAAGDSAATQARRGPDVAEARVELERARAVAPVDGSDFALVALDAYRAAAARVAAEQPACAIEWWALAGISRVEGRHGTYGGARLDQLGWATPDIIGIALNGERNTRVIGDSDGGSFDKDPVYDRAVGPMQFIPSTWRRWAVDGDGDGQANPHNLYDAALAAAGYLCRASHGLDADPGLRAAYFSYNHSLAYVDNVLGWARRYQQLDLDTPAAVR